MKVSLKKIATLLLLFFSVVVGGLGSILYFLFTEDPVRTDGGAGYMFAACLCGLIYLAAPSIVSGWKFLNENE